MSKTGLTLKLVGNDGNAFAILSNADKTMRKAGVAQEERELFKQQATSGDYDNLLRICMDWFEIE